MYYLILYWKNKYWFSGRFSQYILNTITLGWKFMYVGSEYLLMILQSRFSGILLFARCLLWFVTKEHVEILFPKLSYKVSDVIFFFHLIWVIWQIINFGLLSPKKIRIWVRFYWSLWFGLLWWMNGKHKACGCLMHRQCGLRYWIIAGIT